MAPAVGVTVQLGSLIDFAVLLRSLPPGVAQRPRFDPRQRAAEFPDPPARAAPAHQRGAR